MRVAVAALFLLSLAPCRSSAPSAVDAPYIELVPDRYTFEGVQPIAHWGSVPSECCVVQSIVLNGTMLLLMDHGSLLRVSGSAGAREFTSVKLTGVDTFPNGSRLISSAGRGLIGYARPDGLAPLSCALASSAPTCSVGVAVAAPFGSVNAAHVINETTFVAASNGLFWCLRFSRCSRLELPDTDLDVSEHAISALAVHVASGLVAAANARKLWLLTAQGDLIQWEWVTALSGKARGAGGVLDGPVTSLAFDRETGELFAGTEVALNIRGVDGSWRRLAGDQGLPYAPIRAVLPGCPDGVTGSAQHWLGTERGVVVWSTAAEADPPWRYLQGRRWMPGDAVTAIVASVDCRLVLAATDGGVVFYDAQRWTLEAKASVMQAKLVRHNRHGLVAGCPLTVIGDLSTAACVDDDNNGLWTSVVAAAELFRYAVTRDETAARSARHFMGGMQMLHNITGVPGLYARSACAPTDKHCAPARATQRRPCDGVVRPGCCESPGACGLQWRPSADPGYAGWVWKSDASSDETCGHFFAFSIAARLAPTAAERTAAAETVAQMVDYMVDHSYNLVDYNGYMTTWGRWEPRYVNGWRAFSDGRGLNSLQMLAFLHAALNTSSELPDGPARAARRARWNAAYAELTNSTNGYDTNVVNAKIECPIDDNYSDDQLQYMAYYTFLSAATDPARRAPALQSLRRSWDAMRSGRSDLWAAIYMALSGARLPSDLASLVWNLRTWPMELINWNVSNSHRHDLYYSHEGDAFVGAKAHQRTRRVLPANERSQYLWNADPFDLQNVQGWNNEPARRQAGMTEEDPGAWLLPYWLARYHGLIGPAARTSEGATGADAAKGGNAARVAGGSSPRESHSGQSHTTGSLLMGETQHLSATSRLSGDGLSPAPARTTGEAGWLSLAGALVVAPTTSRDEMRAPVDLLLSEGRQRGGHDWQAAARCAHALPCIRTRVVADSTGVSCGRHRLGSGEESSLICASSGRGGGSVVDVSARSKLGLSLACGRLLRELSVHGDGSPRVASGLSLHIDPPPWAAWRGHQFTDWGFYMTDAAFERFVRELLVFGTNRIELAHIQFDSPPRRDDTAALARMSRVADKYGLAVSLYNVPWPSNKTEAAFKGMARVDDLLGEDGEAYGGRQLLQKASVALRRYHPKARVWHDPGAKNASEMTDWFAFLDLPSTRSWLDGVVYGPGILGGAIDLLSRLPWGYPVRLYPDICHTLTAMLPVPDWHYAWAFTGGRHFINPQPRHHADIIRTFQNRSYAQRFVGFGAYSEGDSAAGRLALTATPSARCTLAQPCASVASARAMCLSEPCRI